VTGFDVVVIELSANGFLEEKVLTTDLGHTNECVVHATDLFTVPYIPLPLEDRRCPIFGIHVINEIVLGYKVGEYSYSIELVVDVFGDVIIQFGAVNQIEFLLYFEVNSFFLGESGFEGETIRFTEPVFFVVEIGFVAFYNVPQNQVINVVPIVLTDIVLKYFPMDRSWQGRVFLGLHNYHLAQEVIEASILVTNVMFVKVGQDIH
jgi:hypothetical protein